MEIEKSLIDSEPKLCKNEGYNTSNGCKIKTECVQGSYVPLSKRIHQRIANDSIFFSFEFFPPKTKEGAVNLINRFEQMRQGGPLFIDVTWHAAGNPGSDSETSSITIANVALNYCGLETMLHITCVDLSENDLRQHLQRAKTLGIRNILALRGDNHCVNKSTDFKYAVDLVRFIKKNYGNYFTIAVAGYPTGHPEAKSYEKDLEYLKDKVDAGADFIITQLIFDADIFVKFVKDCKNIGIEVPIIAGIMPIQSYDSLGKIVKLSKLKVPKSLIDQIEPFKDNDEAIRKFGIDWAVKLCKQLIDSHVTHGLHFYTLNREHATTVILKQLGLWGSIVHKPLPWVAPANHRRYSEDVRPIFWASRPQSYVYRTQTWDEFPNGRWGHADSPAFGDLRDYYLFLENRCSKKQLIDMWGHELTSEEDIWHVFYCYVTGSKNKYDNLVSKIPWNTEELETETTLIADKLAFLNKHGVLTINSQPNINGVDSSDPIHGWGEPNGYVYQKAYLEFFTSEKNVMALLKILDKYPLVNYHIVNNSGEKDYTNCHQYKPIAVTWGVFPGNEIIQPTVVDPISFKVWKDEAFGLWKQKWGKLYPKDSQSRKLIDQVYEKYYLVNLVDNEFPKECCLWKLLDEMLQVGNIDSNGG